MAIVMGNNKIYKKNKLGEKNEELTNRNQLFSNFCNKNLVCFLQGDKFPWKPTEESNENILILTCHHSASLCH